MPNRKVEPVRENIHRQRNDKAKSGFQVMGLKTLDSVGIHIFKCFFLSGKIYNCMYFARHFAFQNA